MRVRSAEPAAAAATLLLTAAAAANPTCVTVRAFRGSAVETGARPCAPTPGAHLCRGFLVEAPSEVLYVEVCVPKPV